MGQLFGFRFQGVSISFRIVVQVFLKPSSVFPPLNSSQIDAALGEPYNSRDPKSYPPPPPPRSTQLRENAYIFMRWKERFFVNVGEDCGLTITGFYYVCLDRKDGSIDGYYFDPSSSPFQKLELSAVSRSGQGHSFPAYEFR